TITRLRMTDSTMSELIGVPPDGEFADEESVQAMVVWADRRQREAILTHAPLAAHRIPSPSPEPVEEYVPVPINAGGQSVASLHAPDLMLPRINRQHMPPIPRLPPAGGEVKPYGSIRTVHEDCVAPGVAVREIRPPLTELTPLP